jgi:signal transduction histidine kinase
MQRTNVDLLSEATVRERAGKLFLESQANAHIRADRLFAKLMILQWAAGIGAAFWISPKTWIGTASQVHWHVWAAIFLGGAISGLPVFLAWKQPGEVLTRHVMAVAQMLTSALLIHLTGGRIETHFHVFGSLAFFAFYRDWRVLATATVVVAVDHMARGIFWPQSVFGVATQSPWRWIEHAGWVIFEDTFLIVLIKENLRDMFEAAARRAKLEMVNASIERQVAERTAELTAAHKDLVQASRRAGMAEVATGVLHNVGNVLNSVNVASCCLADSLRKSKAARLSEVAGMLRENAANLGPFLQEDAKGKHIPRYLTELSAMLATEQASALEELKHLQKNIEHIKDIVSMQQSFATISGVIETLPVIDLVEDALRINSSSLARHNIRVNKEFESAPHAAVDKHKMLQILVNLVRNAQQACEASGREEKLLTIRVSSDERTVQVSVMDNGVGIPANNLTRIFHHGFTTRKNGHGFGLHSGALAAREMGGSLRARSEGADRGAEFTLELPLESSQAESDFESRLRHQLSPVEQ